MVLWAGLIGGLTLVLATAWMNPERVWLLPAALLASVGAAGAGVVLARHPLASLAVVLGGFAFAVNSDPGIQPIEALYGLYLYGYLALWTAQRLARGERFVWSSTDGALALLLVVFGALGVVTGLAFGAPLGGLRGDLTAFLVLGLYFPVRDACLRYRYGPEIVFAALLGLAVLLGIQNLLNLQAVIAAATVAWQVADARFAATEATIMVGALGALVLLLKAERWKQRAPLMGLFAFLLGSLILTKGRAFWVAFALGVLLLFLLLRGRHRARFLVLTLGGAALLAVLVSVFFGRVAELLLSGTLNRLALIGAASQDASMLSRVVEWGAVWEYIKANPILGYGFGTEYRYFDILALSTLQKGFIHNGFLAAWFKLGALGLGVLLFLWGRGAYEALRLHRSPTVPDRHHALALAALVSLAALALAANASIFFLVMDQIFVFALLMGLVSGLYARHLGDPVEVGPSPPAASR